jgi:hypothetical protein
VLRGKQSGATDWDGPTPCDREDGRGKAILDGTSLVQYFPVARTIARCALKASSKDEFQVMAM